MTEAIWLVIGLVVLLPILATCVVITRQQHVRFIETFGRYSTTRSAGLSFKLPYPIQIATENFSLKIQEIAEEITVKSSDNAFVIVPIRVQYAATENRASDAFYRLESPERQVASYVINQVRSTASGMDFAELFSAKTRFEEDVAETLTVRLDDYGYVIENVLVDDPQPSTELKQAFDRVLASKRLREAAQNEGEAVRIKAVLEAEASKEAMILKAEGYARFREIIAEGNAKALQDFVGDTGISPQAVLEFFAQTNTMEALRDAAAEGGRTVLVAGDTPNALHALFANEQKDG
ncbi:MAG: SPFH domain-containing protein [Sulfitobacter sp.]|nr:SPFH domain-containing protein [Sulfitobacter sp.]